MKPMRPKRAAPPTPPMTPPAIAPALECFFAALAEESLGVPDGMPPGVDGDEDEDKPEMLIVTFCTLLQESLREGDKFLGGLEAYPNDRGAKTPPMKGL